MVAPTVPGTLCIHCRLLATADSIGPIAICSRALPGTIPGIIPCSHGTRYLVPGTEADKDVIIHRANSFHNSAYCLPMTSSVVWTYLVIVQYLYNLKSLIEQSGSVCSEEFVLLMRKAQSCRNNRVNYTSEHS